MNFIVIFSLLVILDTPKLGGRWIIDRFLTFENIIKSKNFENMDSDMQLRAIDMYNLYMDNMDLRFKSDTVYFKDLQNEKMVNKIGIWFVDHDTLVVNDLEKIATYKYFIESQSDCRLHLKPILKGGKIAKSGSIYKKEECN